MNKINTIKSKMLLYSIIIIGLMTILSIYTLNITNEYKDQIDSMFERNILLEEIQNDLITVDKELLSYLSSKGSTSLNLYRFYGHELTEKISYLSEQINSYNEEELMIIDIKNMVNAYIEIADQAIDGKLRRDVSYYPNRYEEASEIKGYILDYIKELNIRQLGRNATNYISMSKQIERTKKISIILILDLIMLSIAIIYTMTLNMVNPIVKLSHSAEDIAKGRFDTDEIIVDTDDEIKILAMAFNKMKNSIKTYIEELQTKAETEAKLKDQEMKNIKMEGLLDNARLYALQSQVNPHFLFNTINAGVQMAMLEGADNTSEFLESMSRMFRYNIKQIDSEVSLKQEIDNIKDYYDLLKVRFGDLIQFQFMIDETALQLKMPPLILQPIVENSYLHGLSNREDGGLITIKAFKNKEETIITVEDKGNGMSEEIIQKIMEKEEVVMGELEKKSAGIGLHNVIDRLELFYGKRNLFSIFSTIGLGTKVVIKVPNRKN